MSPNAVTVKLPDSGHALLQYRKAFSSVNFNDEVERIILALLANKSFRDLLDAVDNAGSVEGNISCDNARAAEMIREYARKSAIVIVANAKLASIVLSINVVLRRFGFDRKSRRNMVGGKVVPEDNAMSAAA